MTDFQPFPSPSVKPLNPTTNPSAFLIIKAFHCHNFKERERERESPCLIPLCERKNPSGDPLIEMENLTVLQNFI